MRKRRLMIDVSDGARYTLRLSIDQARYLYDAASSYDTRIPAEAHRPLWARAFEDALTKAEETAWSDEI